MQRFAFGHLTLGLILIFGFAFEESWAQAKPFDYVEISLAGQQNIPTSDAFYEFYGTGIGAGLSLRTPFYIGTADVGLQWHKYGKNLVTVPKMTAFFLYAGWGYPLRFGPLEIEPGFRLGNYRMMFEMDNAFKSELDESEFTTSLKTRAQLALGDRASMHIEASRMTVYTYNRLYYTYVGAGISYRFANGSRFQEVLKK
jgi:hypothetical protein